MFGKICLGERGCGVESSLHINPPLCLPHYSPTSGQCVSQEVRRKREGELVKT